MACGRCRRGRRIFPTAGRRSSSASCKRSRARNSAPRYAHGGGKRGIWQRRFWEHATRDNDDYARPLDFIHFNPVKHSWVKAVAEWPYPPSSNGFAPVFIRLIGLARWANPLRRENGADGIRRNPLHGSALQFYAGFSLYHGLITSV